MAEIEPVPFDKTSRIADIRAALDHMRQNDDASNLFVDSEDVDTLIRDCQTSAEMQDAGIQTPIHTDPLQNEFDEEKEKWLQLTGFYDPEFKKLLFQKLKEIKSLIYRQAKKPVEQILPGPKKVLPSLVNEKHRLRNDDAMPSPRRDVSAINRSSRNEATSKENQEYSTKPILARPAKGLETKQISPRGPERSVARPRNEEPDGWYTDRARSKYTDHKRHRSMSPILRERNVPRKEKAYFILKSFLQHPLDIALHGENIWVTSRTNERTLTEAFDSYHIVGLFFTIHGNRVFKGYAELDCRPGNAPRPSWYLDLNWSNSKPFYLRWCSRRFVLFDDIPKLMHDICGGGEWSRMSDCQRLSITQGDNLMHAIHGTYRDKDLIDHEQSRDRGRYYAKRVL